MSEHPDPVVPAARIRYADDQPYSLDHGDIYHARDGTAEALRVFVGPSSIETRADERARRGGMENVVRVGELGFGSGLNFVVTAERCLAAGTRLTFISCEARPIDALDFTAIARKRVAAHPLYRELAELYPPRIRGWHQRLLAGGRVRLHLWLGEARDALADLSGRQRAPLDAWFLDGFAPDRNPDMWEPRLLEGLAALSGAGTRVATFTAAGRVRRALQNVGFVMERVDQRPHKRETLAGTFTGPGLVPFHPPQRVTVVGGGLAGMSIAWQLASSGCAVTVHDDPDSTRSPPGSRLPATVLHSRLLDEDSELAALRCHGFLHASALAARFAGFSGAGALQLPGRLAPERLERTAARYGGSGDWVRWLTPAEATELCRWPLPEGALHLRAAGVVEMPTLVGALSEHAGIELVRRRLDHLPEGMPVVLACGAAVRSFEAARYLEVVAVQGQLDFVSTKEPPRLPLVGAGYLVPTQDGLLAAGSTYEHRPWHPAAASAANLKQLEGRNYQWHYRLRGTRSVSSDRTAIVGRLFDSEREPVPDLYVTTGHGSGGNVTAHLGAGVLTAEISGDCPPLERRLEALLSPLRFRARQARRGIRGGAG